MIERHAHPTLGEVVFHASPLRLRGAPPRARALAPDLGQDNAEVYGALGLGPAELAALAAKGVV
jgi:formyl-CoA transferase